MFQMSLVHDLPVTSKDIAAATAKDPVLARVYSYVMNKRPSKADDALKPYAMRPSGLPVENGCDNSTTIPSLLDDLHETYPGICCISPACIFTCGGQDIADHVCWKRWTQLPGHHGFPFRMDGSFPDVFNFFHKHHDRTTEGLHSTALAGARQPKNVSQLPSYLGLLRYYQRRY